MKTLHFDLVSISVAAKFYGVSVQALAESKTVALGKTSTASQALRHQRERKSNRKSGFTYSITVRAGLCDQV